MAFEPKKFSDIVAGMQGQISALNGAPLSDFEVGSVTRTLVESFSYEVGLLYEKMRLVYLSAFIDNAEGNHLEQVVAVLGIKRGLPDYATGTASPWADDVTLQVIHNVEDLSGRPVEVAPRGFLDR